MTKKSTTQNIMDKNEIEESMSRISKELFAKKTNLDSLAFVGIKTRGEFLAQRLAKVFEKKFNLKVLLATVDITLYRDDFDTLGDLSIGETDILFDVSGKRIVLIDDVLYSGRTIRAAIDQIIDFGRPAEIELAVLIDRGGRELPISANYVGKKVDVQKDQYIKVHLKEIDSEDRVFLYSK